MILDDFATYIAAQSTVFTLNTNLGKALNLDSDPVPDTITVLYEQPGFAPVHVFSTGNPVDTAFYQPSVQTITRSTSYQTARNHSQVVFDLLDGYSGNLPTATGTNYQSIEAVQSPFSIGRDRNDRFLISCNYQVRHV